MHEDDVDKTVEALTDAAIGKRDLKIENRYRCKDGSFIWVDWNVLALAEENTFYTSGRDITERKQTEVERRRKGYNGDPVVAR